jgi:hypothetical protein
VLLLTVLHHSYGALRFATPWRHHVSFVALLLAILLWGMLEVWRRNAEAAIGKVARALFLVIALVGVVAWIGFLEGGYNHLFKIVLTMAGLPDSVLQAFYPPAIYEAPEDWLFETSGVTQFVLALWALRAAVRFARLGRVNR